MIGSDMDVAHPITSGSDIGSRTIRAGSDMGSRTIRPKLNKEKQDNERPNVQKSFVHYKCQSLWPTAWHVKFSQVACFMFFADGHFLISYKSHQCTLHIRLFVDGFRQLLTRRYVARWLN